MTDVIELIRTKRDGGTLPFAHIEWVIDSFTKGQIADEQMSALLMAVFFSGLDASELAIWTKAMIDSGQRLDLSGISRPTVDKHSTGGVGDKVSLIVCPLVAACGAAVPQLGGRGLGHTGGTIDKLEAIPGWSATLSVPQMLSQLDEVGCFIVAPGNDLAPADRKLYALRDVTGTVESIPLIASSIMSKKIAEGTGALILNTTFGSGAFLDRLDLVRELARTMVGIGLRNGVKTAARMTSMETVLGNTVGNSLEVQEAIDCLNGEGPADTIEVTLTLARDMLEMVGIYDDPAPALSSGAALAVFERMVAAQGGDLSVPLPKARLTDMWLAPSSGVIRRLDSRPIGVAARCLGAGRMRKEDAVDPGAGIVCLVKPGDYVNEGDPILQLHANDPQLFAIAREAIERGIEIGEEAVESFPLILDYIDSDQ